MPYLHQLDDRLDAESAAQVKDRHVKRVMMLRSLGGLPAFALAVATPAPS